MEPTLDPAPDLENPCFYNNRELSWLDFNKRVLEETRDDRNSLLEKYKFLAIFSSNLDEFFMVRVAGLIEQVRAGLKRPDTKTQLMPSEQLALISERTHKLVEEQQQIFLHELAPLLKKEGIHMIPVSEVEPAHVSFLEEYFKEKIFPVLTPMAIDAYRPFPMLLNKSLNLAVIIKNQLDNNQENESQNKLAIVQVPSVLDRLIELPSKDGKRTFVLLEQVIAHFIHTLFKGFSIQSITPFRITRNADLTIHEDEAEDLLEEIEEELKKRKWGAAVRLEVQCGSFEMGVVNHLIEELEIHEKDVYFTEMPLDLTFLFSFYGIVQSTHDHLAGKSFIPQPPQDLGGEKDVFAAARKQDILFHHPYESFEPVVEFISQAADDPDVLAIKQTLYRVSGNSPIIKSLQRAAENGKQVTVLVELKARFDEQNNVHWAKELEKAGCHVIYGMTYLKTHSKITLVVRRTKNGIERFVHLGTGNYNDSTARIYTDMGLITTDEEIGIDATNFFNYLSGYTARPQYHHLIVSPFGIRDKFIELIDQEIKFHKQHGNGYIAAKMNSLSDKNLIKKLYEASIAGVKVDLVVRGTCCLRPGVEGISENIRVRSIVGTFLEHTRIFFFNHNGEEKLYLSSADMMTRNMENRVEILFPILKPHLKERIHEWMEIILADNTKAREQDSSGTYHYVQRADGEKEVNSQMVMCEMAYRRKDLKKPESKPILSIKETFPKIGDYTTTRLRKLGGLIKMLF